MSKIPTKHLICAVFAVAPTRAWVVMVNQTQARNWTLAVFVVVMALHVVVVTAFCTRTKLSTDVVSAVVTTRLAVAAITCLIQVRL